MSKFRTLVPFGLSRVMLLALVSACAQASPGGNGDDDGVNDPPGSDYEISCVNGLDDDGDGDTDCDDIDCEFQAICQPEISCDNQEDDDFDGYVDCRDSDCDGQGYCEHGGEVSCGDEHDNDGDTFVDCNDPDCAGAAHCIPESDCANNLDDDEDGLADCLDPNCDGVGICEHGQEVSCDDGEDNDGDGDFDCDDSDCAVLAECVLACPAGSTPTTLQAAGLPVAIPDGGSTQVAVTASGAGLVSKVVVQVGISHTFVSDLVISLESPDGVVRTLSDRNGGAGQNFDGTFFTDDSSAPLADATAPFTGAYRPDENLAALDGHPVAGDWILEVEDVLTIDSGTINSFVLYYCACDGTAGCEIGAVCNDGLDNDGDGDVDCDDADCSAALECAPESDCADGEDNDSDGDADCADADCDGSGICEHEVELSCDDGEDNDADGAVDCADSDCSAIGNCVPESDCHDGLDNDGDGPIDCQDEGCESDPTCEILGETLCGDGIDNDSDGLTDCEEPGCALACAVEPCAAGQTTIGLAADDLPQWIDDGWTSTSQVAVEHPGSVARVVVRLSATHTFDGDLDIGLVSPTGTYVELSTDNGGGGDDYDGTIFVDTAATPITEGVAPFSGSYQPEGELGSLNGESALGTWSLEIYDDLSSDSGSFTAFDLALCVN